MSTAPSRNKTLVFCTAYTGNATRPWEGWDVRYKRWLEAITASQLIYDQILIVDDGSPCLPNWPGLAVLTHLNVPAPAERVVLFHFGRNLGRPSVYDYPGWFRSFTFAATYAKIYDFDKVVHIESDAFLISSRIQRYCNDVHDGWVTFLGPRYNYPESGIQIIAGRGMQLFYELAARPYSDFKGKPIEELLPFTHVETQFRGDRFGEYLTYVPADADWTMQTYVPSATSSEYHWWLRSEHHRKPTLTYQRTVGETLRHVGVGYLDFMATLSASLGCRSYFEIGTDIGNSLRSFRCDAVCVDPHFKLTDGVLEGRRRAHFFQMTSDDFFEHYDLRTYLPSGVDVAFLDGLHHFEVLLRDFANTERFCHTRSVILMHDCLPTNERMAERTFRRVETEDPGTRDHWTGDVWRLLPILQAHRPDLRIHVLDCGPTGLVACTGLDPYSRVLSSQYSAIVESFSKVDLREFGLRRLWTLFPTLDTKELSQRSSNIAPILFGESGQERQLDHASYM